MINSENILMSPKTLAAMANDARRHGVFNFFAACFAGLHQAGRHGLSGRNGKGHAIAMTG